MSVTVDTLFSGCVTKATILISLWNPRDLLSILKQLAAM